MGCAYLVPFPLQLEPVPRDAPQLWNTLLRQQQLLVQRRSFPAHLDRDLLVDAQVRGGLLRRSGRGLSRRDGGRGGVGSRFEGPKDGLLGRYVVVVEVVQRVVQAAGGGAGAGCRGCGGHSWGGAWSGDWMRKVEVLNYYLSWRVGELERCF